MYETCRKVVQCCDACQRRAQHGEVEELKPFLGSTLFKRVGIDLVKFPRAATGEQYLAVARDDFSGWVEARALSSNKAQEVYRFLYEEIICRFGIPDEVLADRGELYGNHVREAAEADGIHLKFTTAYHPQTNGMIERGHRELIQGLAKVVGEDKSNWPKYLHAVLWADRITTKRTTGQSPYRLVYGQDCVLPFDIEEETWLAIKWKTDMTTSELLAARSQQLLANAWLREGAGVRLDKSRESNKRYYDARKNVRSKPLELGEMVLMLDNRPVRKTEGKLRPRWTGPYVIVATPNEGVYHLAELDGTWLKGVISGSRLKRYFAPLKTATC
jgi:hypothetical protein